MSECSLSNSLNLAYNTHKMIVYLMKNEPSNPNIKIYLDALCDFMKKIRDNSTPWYWLDDEYEWIVQMSSDLGGMVH